MNFEEKDLISLQQFKIKNNLDDLPLTANNLFINGYKVIFIKKSKKMYKICASASCHFAPMYTEGTFDVVFASEDLEFCKAMFQSYVIRAFSRFENVVY